MTPEEVRKKYRDLQAREIELEAEKAAYRHHPGFGRDPEKLKEIGKYSIIGSVVLAAFFGGDQLDPTEIFRRLSVPSDQQSHVAETSALASSPHLIGTTDREGSDHHHLEIDALRHRVGLLESTIRREMPPLP